MNVIQEDVLQEVVTLLNDILDDVGKETANHNYYYYCPFCNHHKRKLAINIKNGNFQCWTCPDTNHTKGRSLFSLLSKLHVQPSKRKELQDLIGSHAFQYSNNTKEEVENIKLHLPKEFIPLYLPKPQNMWWNRAHYYCKQERGLTDFDIQKYGIGYCETGQYAKRIIIPSYSRIGDVNYFTGRDFTGTTPLKYKNPPVSRNIIGFELFICWDEPVILVEGMLDAIKMSNNAIPLFGKQIPDVLYDKILKSKVKDIYIGLDNDAQQDMADITLELENNGMNVYWIPMPKGKDLGDMTHEECMDLLSKDSYRSGMKDVIRNKLSNLFL